MYRFFSSDDNGAPRDNDGSGSEEDEVDDAIPADDRFTDEDEEDEEGEEDQPWFDQAVFQFPNFTAQDMRGKQQSKLAGKVYNLVRDGLLTDKSLLARLDEPFLSMAKAAIVQFRHYVERKRYSTGRTTVAPDTQQHALRAARVQAIKSTDVLVLRATLRRLRDSAPSERETEEKKERQEEKVAGDAPHTSGDDDTLSYLHVESHRLVDTHSAEDAERARHGGAESSDAGPRGRRHRRVQTSFASYFVDPSRLSGVTTARGRRELTEYIESQVDRFLQDLVNRGHLRQPFIYTFQVHPAMAWDESARPATSRQGSLVMAKYTLDLLLQREGDRSVPLPSLLDLRLMGQSMDRLAL
jgi:hypothetical protein